jgi:hypothetical protein
MKKIAYLFFAFLAFGFSSKAQDSLAQYTGKFNFPEGSIVAYVTVTAEAGKLSFSSDKGSGTLERITPDSFAIPEYQGTGKYTRNADNKVIGVVIDVMGYHLDGVKETPAIALIDRQLFLKSERKQFTIR